MGGRDSSDAAFEVVPAEAGVLRARLEAHLPPGWLGNLTAQLAARGVSIDRAHARGEDTGLWRASFEVRCDPGTALPEDWVALARRPGREGFRTDLPIESYALRRPPDAPHALDLRVRGRDTVGFLAALLRRLAFLALFPVEAEIETKDGRVDDRLALRSAGHRNVSPDAEAILRATLDRLCKEEGAEL